MARVDNAGVLTASGLIAGEAILRTSVGGTAVCAGVGATADVQQSISISLDWS